MLSQILECLVCPLCGAGLGHTEASLRCGEGHTFDVARQGYANLTTGGSRPSTGDTAAMVQARADFLSRGHFTAIADGLSEMAERHVAPGAGGCVLDVGAGTGYYLAHVLDRMPARVGLALDASKHAARRAARAHPAAGSVVCDTWGTLPVQSGSAALVLDVFAPRNPPEFKRVLRPGGALLVVTPTQDHLRELMEPLRLLSVDARKDQRLNEQFGALFKREESLRSETTMLLSSADVAALAHAGPTAWHSREAELQARIAGLPETMEVTASVMISAYAACG